MYYPGVTFEIPIARNGLQPLMRFYVPTQFLMVYCYCAYMAASIEDKSIAAQGCGLCLIGLTLIYNFIRTSIAKTKVVTIMENIVFVYMAFALALMIDTSFELQWFKGTNGKVCFYAINGLIFLFLFIKYLLHWSSTTDVPFKKANLPAEAPGIDRFWRKFDTMTFM